MKEINVSGWGKVREVAKYTGLSERTLRDLFKAGLRHARLPSGTILVKYEWIDEYLEKFERSGNTADAVVDSIMKELKV